MATKIKPNVYIDPETLVNCQYCGSAFNYMLSNCPNCGGANDLYDDVVKAAEAKQKQYEDDVHNREMDKIHNTNVKAKSNVVFKILGIVMLFINIFVAVPFFIYALSFIFTNL